MSTSREEQDDETVRSRMKAMLAAMRRPGVGRVDAEVREHDDLLAAVVRRAVQQDVPDATDGARTRAADVAGHGVLETRVPRDSRDRLGRYLLIEELGRGGMGRVLRAYDPKLEREVALKVLKVEATEASGWARMVREARSMAKLNHPHVVAVYDVVEDSRHGLVIAMELVRGTTLKNWLEQQPRPWGEVLEAFIEAGLGLAAAHHQGLLHRDFKPANALVVLEHRGTRGPVKVADFGLARRSHEPPTVASPSSPSDGGVDGDGADKTLTEAGAVMGTPVYMAPEQHRGDALTSAADQYAFCVALWEALYGERPFGGTSLAEIIDNVCNGRRRPPPQGRVVPARLRRACERGMSVDPQQRWPSMEALLTELRKLVAPRTGRWAALGLTAGLMVLGGGLGLGQYAEVMDRCTGALVQLEGVWDEGRKQEVQTAILGTELVYAPGTWERVEQRLDDYAEAWADKHTEVCEATRVTEEQSEEAMDLRMRCLRGHRTAFGAAVKVLAGADAEVVENAVRLAANLPLLERCDDVDLLDQQRQRVPPPEDPLVAQEVESLRERLADIEAEQKAGKFVLALEHVESMLEPAEALEYPPLLAEVKLRHGALLSADGRYAEAEQALGAAYTLAVEQEHDEVALRSAVELIYSVGYCQARHAEGIVWGQTAVPLAERGGKAVDLADSLNSLGNVLGDDGEHEQSKVYHQRALQIREEALGLDHPDTAGDWNNLGVAFQRQGEYEQALLHYQRALRISETALGGDHPNVATILSNLSTIFADQGEYEQAMLHGQRALQIREKALGADHPDVAISLTNLGLVFRAQGEYEQAKRHDQRAMQIRTTALGAEHPDVAGNLNNLGTVFHDQGEYEQAKRYHQRALQIREKSLGVDHPDVAISLTNLATVSSDLGEDEQAMLYDQRALRIREKALGVDHPDVAVSLNNVASGFQDQGELEQAELYYRRALQIWEKTLGGDHVLLTYPLVGLAEIGLAQKQFDSARAHAERALSIRQAREVTPDMLANARYVLAQALWADPSQRARSRILAEQARDGFAELGDVQRKSRVEVEQWLAGHRVR